MARTYQGKAGDEKLKCPHFGADVAGDSCYSCEFCIEYLVFSHRVGTFLEAKPKILKWRIRCNHPDAVDDFELIGDSIEEV